MAPIQELIKKRIAFGAWCVFEDEVLDEARCRRIRESGLDFGYIGVKADHSDLLPILDACEKAGLLAILFDPQFNLHADQAYRVPKILESYKDHPALAGVSLRDEPGVCDFPRLRRLTDAFLKAAPDKMPAVNLYPIYANSDQLNDVTYEEYVEKYADELAVDTLSYDFYPLYGVPGGETWLQDNYLRNFEIVARACKRTGKDLWYFIQALCFNYICREPDEKDIRWQIYAAMSFGTKVIQVFTYGTPGNGGEVFEDAMIGRDGNITPRYTAMQKVIGEMNRFTGCYVPYSWEGVMTRTRNLDRKERTMDLVFPDMSRKVRLKGTYMDIDHPLASFDPIVDFDGDQPLLMGCFSRGEKKAFTLVNMSDPARNLDAEVTVRFDAPKTLRIHGKNGSQDVAVSAEWTRTLESGEGLFIEIL